jgi:hypothetical protein
MNGAQFHPVKTMNSDMNTRHFRESRLLAAVAALALGATGPGFAQNETQLPSTIVRLNGHARCSTDAGKTWRMAKDGDTLDSGAMIQTAKKSELDLVLGGRAEAQPDNLVRLAEDTLLRLDKVAKKRSAGSQETVEEISLDLRTGAIAGNVRSLAAASRYEVTLASGIAGLREGSYRLRANGELAVLKGKAFIALTDGRPAKEIGEGQQFNPATGIVAALPPQATPPPVESQPNATASSESTAKPAPPVRETAPPARRVKAPNTGLRRAVPY